MGTWVEQNVPNCRATTPIHFFLSSVVKKFFQMRIGRVRHLHFHPRNSSNSVFFSTESSTLSLSLTFCAEIVIIKSRRSTNLQMLTLLFLCKPMRWSSFSFNKKLCGYKKKKKKKKKKS